MKIALLSVAMLGSQLVTPVGDRVPKLNVEATCKATVAADKAMGLVLTQSDCMRDENAAQQQLAPVWLSNSDELRNRCEGEATAGGTDSYSNGRHCQIARSRAGLERRQQEPKQEMSLPEPPHLTWWQRN